LNPKREDHEGLQKEVRFIVLMAEKLLEKSVDKQSRKSSSGLPEKSRYASGKMN